jgi:hypothetical protein
MKRRISILGAVLAAALSIAVAVSLSAVVGTASAAIPSGIGFTQEGCNNPGGLVLPNGSGQFICPNTDYTTGNLGKNWSELDLVPLRVTVSAGNSAPSSATFSFAVAVDNTDSGLVGFDVLSAPVLNTSLSDASCSAATVGAQTTANGQLLRQVTVTVHQSTDCVYDYYARLAIGAHLYPGSSLHANLADDVTGSTSGIGTKAVSINPKEVAPQSISKDMTATQDSDHVWDVTKSPTPASLSFTNTCDPAASLSQGVQVKVSWTKEAATPSGVITVVTHVYATNPSTRTVTVSVSDQLYSGTTAIGSPIPGGPVDVPANTANALIINSTTTVPSGTTNINDIATATYTDKVTGVGIPGTTTATASATVQTGNELDASAVIGDTESITGTGLAFSVDSTTGASGTFGGGYVLGTQTSGTVSWTSSTQSSSGSVTFNKTVYATAATVVSGSLDDTATLTGHDGFTTQADLSVDLGTNASTSLTVTKDATLSFTGDKTYTFHLFNGADVDQNKSTTVTIPGGSNGPVTSDPITGLSPTGTYYVKEDANAPFGAQTSSPVTYSLVAGNQSSCSADIQLTNSADPATAQVKKNTVPASSGLWTFTLTGPGGFSRTLTNVQAGGGYFPFAGALDVDGGTYTITETPQTGYDLTGVNGDIGGNSGRVSTDTTAKTCSFTLDLTTDSGHVFECTFTNTQRGNIIVKKVTHPSGSTQSFNFTPSWGSGFSLQDGQSNDSGLLVPGGGYSVSESAVTGWDLTSATCDNGDSPSNITLAAGATVTCIFTNTQRGHIIVKKVTNPSGSTQSFTFTPSYNGGTTFALSDGGSNDSGLLLPGSGYSVSETVPTGWDQTGATCDNGNSPSNITLAAGATVTCTFTNTQRGHIIVQKVTNPSGSTQLFTFNASYYVSSFQLADGGSNTSGPLIPGSGYSVSEAAVSGWDLTSATCDNGNKPSNITVAAGQTVTCTFTNRQRGHAKVVKTVSGNALSGSQSFTFQLRSGASAVAAGTILETGVANVADSGVINFTTYLVPGQTYQLCEQMSVGWMTSLGPPLYSVYNPSGDNSVVCTDFTVTAGQTRTFAIDNKPPPGGMALTIGFWKNWSSCSGGKQKPTLDVTLLAAANAGNPITIGLLVLNPNTLGASTACKYAVNVLNKTTINGKAKESSDPLFNMAAQLLAADLNVQGGAGSCAASTSAITQAQQLLVKYNWNGTAPPYSPKLTSADTTLANQLATSLDKYNNNKLC